MVSDLNREAAQVLWVEVTGSREANACGVDLRHDAHGTATVGRFSAADAAFELCLCAQEVFVRHEFSMDRRLHVCLHEGILLADLLDNSLLLLVLLDVKLDLVQVQAHFGGVILHTSGWASLFVPHQDFGRVPLVGVDADAHLLLDEEADVRAGDATFRVVHVHFCLGAFGREAHVLLEFSRQLGVALAHTAPSFDLIAVCLILAHLEDNRRLAHSDDLLHLHFGVLVVAELRLQVVFNLGLGLCVVLLVDEVVRRRNSAREREVEGDLVVAGHQMAAGHAEHSVVVL